MKTNKKVTINRLKIIEGHLRKVREMVEENRYCIDILNQSLAVQNALKRVDEIILEDHLKTCVSKAIKNNRSEKSIREILDLLKRKS